MENRPHTMHPSGLQLVQVCYQIRESKDRPHEFPRSNYAIFQQTTSLSNLAELSKPMPGLHWTSESNLNLRSEHQFLSWEHLKIDGNSEN